MHVAGTSGPEVETFAVYNMVPASASCPPLTSGAPEIIPRPDSLSLLSMAGQPPRFSYYNRLSAKNKAIYRRGDAIVRVELPDDPKLHVALQAASTEVGAALAAERPSRVRPAAQRICDLVTEALATERAMVKVLRVRPRRSASELHGLYTRDDGSPPTIRVWMRTAARADVVKARTFLRTLVHEVCHHLDYAHYRLGESFHNAGFFKRESSLMRMVTAPAYEEHPAGETVARSTPADPPSAASAATEPVQLRLPEL